MKISGIGTDRDRDRNVSGGFRKVPGRYRIMSGRCLMSAGVMKVFKRGQMIPARCQMNSPR